MDFKKLTFERLLDNAEQFWIFANDSYVETYPEFLKYFESLNLIEKHHLIISSHFVYGWMPTIIYIDTKEIDKVLFLLNAVKSGHDLKLNELETLKFCINNSMVGLSKLLHFINPRDYAIWDSRILRYITGKKSQYGIDKPENYLAYLVKMKEIINNKGYSNLHHLIERHFDYSITPMRAVEILMFETDKKGANGKVNKSILADRMESEGFGTFEPTGEMDVEYEEEYISEEEYKKIMKKRGLTISL